MPTGGSGAPVELVQRAGVTLPGAHVGIGPAAALAARQVHTVDLEAGRWGGARDLRRLPRRVLDRPQPLLTDVSDSYLGNIPPLAVGLLGSDRQAIHHYGVP